MTQKTSFKVTYIGGPTAILEIGGLRIMTDPTLDPPGVYHSGVLVHEKLKGPANVDIGKIDIVLLSHDQHFDNLDYGGRALLKQVPREYRLPLNYSLSNNFRQTHFMKKNYPSLAFTTAVKEMQEKLGSRAAYARIEKSTFVSGLTASEVDFISRRDSFYMATISENGYPYIQHRGGPRGFLKVLDPKRLGVIDFKGNAQYISVGNIATHNNIAIIMVDYPARARLKIFAKATIVELKDDPALYHSLDLTGYKFKPERMMVFDVEAYDWNCPQHITPRYTVEDMEEIYAGQLEHINKLEAEIKKLRAGFKET